MYNILIIISINISNFVVKNTRINLLIVYMFYVFGLKSSTSDTTETIAPATSDTAVKNSNGTVQTGQSNVIVVLSLRLILSAAAVVVFMRFRYCD